MERLFVAFVLATYLVTISEGMQLTFTLPDNEKMCFYESVNQEEVAEFEFQVLTGGNYDVDVEMTGPNGQILYKADRKETDHFKWKADQKGIHKFCFSNEFSSLSHKMVFFYIHVGEEIPIIEELIHHKAALTLMESSVLNIFFELERIGRHQTHFRLHDAQGRMFAEDLNYQVLYWSIGESLIVIFLGIGQVLILRSFFSVASKTLPPTVH